MSRLQRALTKEGVIILIVSCTHDGDVAEIPGFKEKLLAGMATPRGHHLSFQEQVYMQVLQPAGSPHVTLLCYGLDEEQTINTVNTFLAEMSIEEREEREMQLKITMTLAVGVYGEKVLPSWLYRSEE